MIHPWCLAHLIHAFRELQLRQEYGSHHPSSDERSKSIIESTNTPVVPNRAAAGTKTARKKRKEGSHDDADSIWDTGIHLGHPSGVCISISEILRNHRHPSRPRMSWIDLQPDVDVHLEHLTCRDKFPCRRFSISIG